MRGPLYSEALAPPSGPRVPGWHHGNTPVEARTAAVGRRDVQMTAKQLGTCTCVGYAAHMSWFAHPDTVVHDEHAKLVVNSLLALRPGSHEHGGRVLESASLSTAVASSWTGSATSRSVSPWKETVGLKPSASVASAMASRTLALSPMPGADSRANIASLISFIVVSRSSMVEETLATAGWLSMSPNAP